jgi:phage-related protein
VRGGEAVMARIEASVPCLWIYSGQQCAFAGTTKVSLRSGVCAVPSI